MAGKRRFWQVPKRLVSHGKVPATTTTGTPVFPTQEKME